MKHEIIRVKFLFEVLQSIEQKRRTIPSSREQTYDAKTDDAQSRHPSESNPPVS